MNIWDDDENGNMDALIDVWVTLPIEEHIAGVTQQINDDHASALQKLQQDFAAKTAALERKTARSLVNVQATAEKQRLKRKVEAYIAKHELDDYFFKLSREEITARQSRAVEAAEAAAPSTEQVVAVVNAAILQDVYKHVYPEMYPRLKERVDALKLLHRIVRDSSPAKKEALRRQLSRGWVDHSSRITAAATANAMEVFGLLHLGLGCTNESEVELLAQLNAPRAEESDEEYGYGGIRDDDDENEGAPNPYDEDEGDRDERANLERKIRVYERAVRTVMKREGLMQIAMHHSRSRTSKETSQAIAEHEVDKEKVRATLNTLNLLQNKKGVAQRAEAAEEPVSTLKKKSKPQATSSFTRIGDPLRHIGEFVGKGGSRRRTRRSRR